MRNILPLLSVLSSKPVNLSCSPDLSGKEERYSDQGEDQNPVDGRLLCQDDYEICNFWNALNRPCMQSSGPEVLACPRRCGACADNRPMACEIARHVRGLWRGIQETVGGQMTTATDLIVSKYTVQV